jgi:UDP-N-acetylmuramate dehydrogenase
MMERMVTLLSDLTTLHLGGPAHQLLNCISEAELVHAVRAADATHEPLLVLGGGSNVVVADDGLAGPVACVRTSGVRQRDDGDDVLLTAAAGESWDALVEKCVNDGLAGFECLSGIPGSVGATPIQNVGAYGQEVCETIVRVRAYDRLHHATVELVADDCRFTYRSSTFKRSPNRWIVLDVTFALPRRTKSNPIRYGELARALNVPVGDSASLVAVRAAVLQLRRHKGMVLDSSDPDTVSAGSFFLNPVLHEDDFATLLDRVRDRLGPDARPPMFPQPDGWIKTSAAWLIERAGFQRGYGNPRGIAISSKHTLALTNRGDGTTRELIDLAREIADRVHREFGVMLHPEPVLVGEAWPPPVPTQPAAFEPAGQ